MDNPGTSQTKRLYSPFQAFATVGPTDQISNQMAAGSEAKERKILVAVDEGEESSYALSWCLKNIVAENSKDTLILLFSKQPPPLYPALDGTGNF